jgi:hypothetical protein
MNSCINKQQNSDLISISLRNFETDLDIRYLTIVPNQKKLNDSSINLYFQNVHTREIHNYRLNRESFTYISEIQLKNPEFYFKYCIISKDSILAYNSETHLISLIKQNKYILDTFDFTVQYVPVAIPQMNLKGGKNQFIIGNSSRTIGVANKIDRIKYYKTIKPILLFNINKSNLKFKTIAQFPEHYIKSGNNYQEYYPSACFGKDENICVSFGADDYLTLYHDSITIIRKKVKSKYIDTFQPYPDDKFSDMLYLKKYWAEEPKYRSIVYDSFENCYYRIVKHRGSINKDISTKIIWSIIKLDAELNILGEVKIDSIYKSEFLVPTPFGILMAKESSKNPGKAILSLIKFKKK